jgi:hypothetical protein
MLVLEQQGGVLEQPLLAGGRDVEQDVACCEQLRDAVHPELPVSGAAGL